MSNTNHLHAYKQGMRALCASERTRIAWAAMNGYASDSYATRNSARAAYVSACATASTAYAAYVADESEGHADTRAAWDAARYEAMRARIANTRANGCYTHAITNARAAWVKVDSIPHMLNALRRGMSVHESMNAAGEYIVNNSNVSPRAALDYLQTVHAMASRVHYRATLTEYRAQYNGMDDEARAIAAWTSIMEDSKLMGISDAVCDASRGYVRGYITLEHYVPREGKEAAHWEVVKSHKLTAARGRIIVPALLSMSEYEAPSLYARYEGYSASDESKLIADGKARRVPTGELVKITKTGAAIPLRESAKKFFSSRVLPAMRAALFLALDDAEDISVIDLVPRSWRARYVPSLTVS